MSMQDLYQDVHFANAVQQFLDSPVGKYIIQKGRDEAAESLFELRDVDHTDSKKIQEIQNRIRVSESVEGWLTEALLKGASAEKQIVLSLDDYGMSSNEEQQFDMPEENDQ